MPAIESSPEASDPRWRGLHLAAWVVIVASVLGLGLFVPGVGIAMAVGSVVLLWFWYVRVARGLVGLGRPPRPYVASAGVRGGLGSSVA